MDNFIFILRNDTYLSYLWQSRNCLHTKKDKYKRYQTARHNRKKKLKIKNATRNNLPVKNDVFKPTEKLFVLRISNGAL